MTDRRTDLAEKAVQTPLRLTLAGLWAEALVRALWPLWTLLLFALTVAGFGVQDHLPIEAVWLGLITLLAAAIAALIYAARQFSMPSKTAARARLDATVTGAPLAALADAQAIGADDPGSAALWAAHRTRMAQRLVGLRAPAPNLRLAARDPFALRYLALLGVLCLALFGSAERLTSLATLAPNGTAPMGPMWEGWATPPAYTGKPALYLNDVAEGILTLPVGTKLHFRLYGAVGDALLEETISARTAPPPASEPVQEFTLAQSGDLAVTGRGGRAWPVIATPDAPPRITATGKITRSAEGLFKQPFTAEDDYGVTKGAAEIALDLPAVDRRYGLATAPENPPAARLALSLPRRAAKGGESKGTLSGNLSQHLLSNMPVTLTLTATDAAGQSGRSEAVHITLPGRRFFDPLAAALIEMRRDLLWSRQNAARSLQILRAITHAPEGFIRNQRAYLRLRVAIKRLGTEAATLTPSARDEIAAELWEIALLVEEGDLQSAKERLRRAQDRLDEAIRKGADPAEIDALMDEMQDALDDYLRQLAEEAKKRGDEDVAQGEQGPSVSADQLQQMLDKLKELMEQGKTAEAAELMQQLRDFMENMQVAEGEGGQGQGGPGSQSLRDLGKTLRDQQGLADDAFRDMQRQGNGESEGEGEGEGGKSLAQRQEELQKRLEDLERQGTLPGEGSEAGESGRANLGEAGRAMDEAEEALRNGDLPSALDRQAEALESLREGIADLGDALADEQLERGDAEDQAEGTGQDSPEGTDPLGRRTGQALRNGSDENLLQGEDVQRRADELLEEIRRRQGEALRPEEERGYLKRLLDLF